MDCVCPICRTLFVPTLTRIDSARIKRYHNHTKEKFVLQINYSKQAIKFLSKQDKPTRIRIVTAINSLPNGDVKKLQGQEGYRLRVGDFRIIFDYEGNILWIEKIDNRGQVYKS